MITFNDKEKRLTIVVLGNGTEAEKLCSIFDELGAENLHTFKNGENAIAFLEANQAAIIYVVGEIEKMRWLSLAQYLRTTTSINFCPIVFIRTQFQEFKPGELESVGKYLFIDIRLEINSKNEILKEFDELAVNNQNPKSAVFLINKAKKFYKSGLLKKANEVYENLSKEISQDLSVMISATECSKYDLDQYDRQLRSLLNQDPENISLKFQMLKYMATNDKPDEFGKLFNMIINDASKNEENFWLRQLGEICLKYSVPVFSEKITQLIEEKSSDEDKWQIFLFKARKHIAHGELDKGETSIKKAKELADQEKPEIYNLMGVIAKRKGNIRDALGAFQKAQKLADWDYRITLNIALCHVSQGKKEKAIECLKKILIKNPKYDKAYHILATLRRKSA